MNDSFQSSCPKCGAPIAGDAPQGLCPKCVLAQAATEIDPGAGPSKRTPPPTVAEVAAHFPELEIEELIGAGGMGAVYKARQPQLDRVVALKVLAHELSEDPAFVERFNREGRVLARLSHPNIVAVYDTGTAGPFAFLLMEYVDGVNLRQAMRTGRFTPVEALTLVEEICAALKFAHGEGILHRDIKPENILIDSRGQVKIADFGIAKLVDQDGGADLTLTLEGSILGSPHYMAPEQIETPGDVDQRADIYSLGVVFYEMLTGELPMGRFALPSEKSSVDARIDEIVLKTLAREREARFQSAGEVQTEVESITRSGLKNADPSSAAFASADTVTAAGLGVSEGRLSRAVYFTCALFGGIVGLLIAVFDFHEDAVRIISNLLGGHVGPLFELVPYVILLLLLWIPIEMVLRRGMGLVNLTIGLTSCLLPVMLIPSLAYRGGVSNALPILFAVPLVIGALGVVVFLARPRSRQASASPIGDRATASSETKAIAPDSRGPLSKTSRLASIAAVLASACVLLCAWPLFLWKDAEGAVHSVSGWVTLFLVALLPPFIPGLLAVIFGGRSLSEIRQSDGRMGGYAPSLFGVLALPTIVLVIMVTVLVTGYRPSMAILKVGGYETDWRYGEPEVTFEVKVAARQVVTFELIHEDEVGRTEVVDGFEGYILAADSEPWQGTLKIGTLPDGRDGGAAPSLPAGMGDAVEIVLESAAGERSRAMCGLPESWVLSDREPAEIDLEANGEYRFDLAHSASRTGAISLRIASQPRRVPGIPAVAFDHYVQAQPVFGIGGKIEWIRTLMEGLEKSLPEGEAYQPPRQPEPEWREGSPESHVNLTIEPGVVAEIELTGPGANGESVTYHRGYIVASDLEPWEGKMRVGSLAGSSDIQWRVEGPFNTVTADIDPGWTWQVEPMVTTSHVRKPQKPTVKLIAAGTVRSGGGTSLVSFVVKPVERSKVKADLPEVMPFHAVGLGEAPDWIGDIQRVVEMNATQGEPDLLLPEPTVPSNPTGQR